MTFFLKQTKMENIASDDIEKKLLSLSQELVELRIKKITRQAFKPHEFKHKKRQISQLLTLQNLKNKQN
jgi:large subunit ribosomal protein L29